MCIIEFEKIKALTILLFQGIWNLENHKGNNIHVFLIFMAHGQTWTCFLFSQTLIVTKNHSVHSKDKIHTWYVYMIKTKPTEVTKTTDFAEWSSNILNIHNVSSIQTPPPLKKGPRTSAERVININFVYKIRSIQVVTICSNTVLFFFCLQGWWNHFSPIRKIPTISETTSWSATTDWSMISNEAN